MGNSVEIGLLCSRDGNYALIGSEAPGRFEWALNQGADAQLVKPVGDSGVCSALLIALQAFEARRDLAAQIADLRARLADRQTVGARSCCLRRVGAANPKPTASRAVRCLACWRAKWRCWEWR